MGTVVAGSFSHSPPRPAFLQGTTISTREYISLLYKMMLPLFTPIDINKNVALFRPEIPLTKILNYVSIRRF